MPIDFSKSTLHDPKDKEVEQLLKGIQGNILKGHGREHTVHIFVKFDSSDKKLKQKLSAVADEVVTSAWQQQVETKQYKNFKIPGAMFANLFLTAAGYKALGFSEAQMKPAFSDELFLKGITGQKTVVLNDPPPSKWEAGYGTGDIDAMFLLADDDKDFLMRQARVFMNRLDKFCEIKVVEQGDALRNRETNEGIEHFGYVDGRSQPIYLLGDEQDEGKTDKWNPVEPLAIVLTEDVISGGKNNFGSYFVFRKLEQNVLGFKTRELELADELGFQNEEKERAGAMAVGRFEDGTPLVLSQTDGFVPKKENNFTYADDDDVFDEAGAVVKAGGLKCPYQAHIRKTNPRGDTVRRFQTDEREAERNRRVTRRGITFGKREKHPNDAQALADFPTKGVGLLFMCFQSSITDQFAFMQASWVNEEKFVRGFQPGETITGIDPVIGQCPINTIPAPQNWRPHYGDAVAADDPADEGAKEFSFQGFVKMKGGEFFFAPSIAFLKTFAASK